MAAVRRTSNGQPLAPNASVLEYARFHRICRDHTRDDPLDPRYLPQAPIFLTQDLTDPPGSQSQLSRLPDTSERFGVDAATADVLKSLRELQRQLPVTENDSRPRLLRHLKVETPLLETDHELDALKFRKRDPLRLKDVTLPLEYTDDEQDEGIAWPSWSKDFPKKCLGEIASDKLEIPAREALIYLQSVSKPPEKPAMPEPAPAKRTAVQPVTPPLLLLSPEFTHVPDPSSSSPTGQLQLLTGTTNSTAAEAEALEAEILKKDSIETHDVPGLKYYTEDPMLWEDDIEDVDEDESALPPRARRHAAELKVEAPLMPTTTLLSAFRSSAGDAKSVSFPDEMLEYIPYPAEVPSKYENGNSVLDSENDFDAFFEEGMAPIAEKADWRAEHEQLEEADTTKRVEVPHLKFEAPVAPWHAFTLKASLKRYGVSTELQAQARLLSCCANEDLDLSPEWKETDKDVMGLTWAPFPKDFPKVTVAETIQHDAALDQTIGSSTLAGMDIVESGSLAWKLEGLRILDQPEEEEEEISPWNFEPGDDLDSLLRQRRLEMANVPTEQPQKKQKTKGNASPKSPRWESTFTFGGLFSTSGSLDQFIQVNSGIMKPRQPPEARQADPPKKQRKDTAEDHAPSPVAADQAFQNTPTPTPVPAPPIPDNLPPKAFIISSSLLTQRRELVRAMQQLYPRATLIERDFSKPLFPNTSSRPLSAEPDLILSPSTGLLLTTLQRIKQRALPGSGGGGGVGGTAATTNVQAEIAQCAAKLQRLVVLVSAATPPSTAAFSTSVAAPTPYSLDARDCEALASLHGFAAAAAAAAARDGQQGAITVAYVPGGEADLARWIVGAMVAYGRTEAELLGCASAVDKGNGGSSVLKEDESLWELFLRRAGLNAFAAQVVLARLKKEEEGESGSGGSGGAHGLAAFVGMAAEERREFGWLVGGEAVLEAVGRRVDGVWTTPKE